MPVVYTDSVSGGKGEPMGNYSTQVQLEKGSGGDKHTTFTSEIL